MHSLLPDPWSASDNRGTGCGVVTTGSLAQAKRTVFDGPFPASSVCSISFCCVRSCSSSALCFLSVSCSKTCCVSSADRCCCSSLVRSAFHDCKPLDNCSLDNVGGSVVSTGFGRVGAGAFLSDKFNFIIL